MTEEISILGNMLSNGKFRPSGEPAELIFRDGNTGRNYFSIDKPTLFRNLLLMGGAGSGKTTIINQAFRQLRDPATDDPNDRYFAIVFDTKSDYIAHRDFLRPGDYIIGNSSRFRRRSASWNIFAEVLVDGEEPENYEANAREIASILFEGRGSTTQPFFANAARDLFAYTIIYFIRRCKDKGGAWLGNLNNQALCSFLRNYDAEQLGEKFSIYEDMRFLKSYFGNGTSNQALGVFAELHSMLSDCFQGIFIRPAALDKSFSIRKAVRQKGNHALFIEYDMALGHILTPMYRLLVDLALKEALSSQTTPGRTYLLLDELKLLPKLTHLQDALNYGRSHQVAVLGGIQTVDQLYSIYGEHPAQEILEGFGSLFALKTTDHASREYISRRFGPNVTGYRYYNASHAPVDREREGYVVEHRHQQMLQRGQAVVGLASQPDPFLFQFERDRFA